MHAWLPCKAGPAPAGSPASAHGIPAPRRAAAGTPGRLGRDWVFLAPAGAHSPPAAAARGSSGCRKPPGACQRHDASAWCSGPHGPAVPSWRTTAGLEPAAELAPTGCTVIRWVHRGPGWSAGPLPASIPCRRAHGHPQAHKDVGTGCTAVGRAGEASMPSAQRGTTNTSVPETRPQKLPSPCGQGGLAAAVPSWGGSERSWWSRLCQAWGRRGHPGGATLTGSRAGCTPTGVPGERGAEQLGAGAGSTKQPRSSGAVLHPLPLPGRRARRGGAHKGCTDGRAHRGAAAAPRCWL